MPIVRVLLIDEHRMLTDVLADRLADEADIVVAVDDSIDPAHVDRLIARVRPEVVVTTNLAIGRSVVDSARAPALVVLAPDSEQQDAVAAARVGAVAWLPMVSSVDDLLGAIRGAAAGFASYPGEHLTAVLRELRRDVARTQGPAGPLGSLSGREREVLECLVEGRSSKDIARRLGMSDNTVRTHTRNLFRKLDVHSRLEAVSVARNEAEGSSRRHRGGLRAAADPDRTP